MRHEGDMEAALTRRGFVVLAESVATSDHRTIDAYDEYARIHELELDVYFR